MPHYKTIWSLQQLRGQNEVGGGGGAKNLQASFHIVVEWPLVKNHPTFVFLKLMIHNKIYTMRTNLPKILDQLLFSKSH